MAEICRKKTGNAMIGILKREIVVVVMLFGMTAVMSSCIKERINGDEPEEQDFSECIVEDFSLSVNDGTLARATVDEHLKVKFQEGDRIWCIAKDTHGILAGLGYLTLENGAGDDNATFTGQYAYKNGATICEFYYMLLSADTEAYEIKTVADRSITWVTPEVSQWPFPANDPLPSKICSDLNDAVERFGVFSCKVEAEEHPTNITLAQEKSFIVFSLGFDASTGIKSGDNVELSCIFTTSQRNMFPGYTTTVSDDSDSSVGFVLPMDSTFSKAQIVIPREHTSALAVKFGKADNVLSPGSVYNVNKTVTSDNRLALEKDMPTGFIGWCVGDVEGIIVDLGERGRIVVDIHNLYALSSDDPGPFCPFTGTYDMGNGWKALSHDDFCALLSLEHTWNAERGGGVEYHFDLQGFNTSTTLFLPAGGYDDNGTTTSKGTLGFYWTSSFTDWEKIDAFVMEFGENGFQSVTSTVTSAIYSIRRYHTIDDL